MENINEGLLITGGPPDFPVQAVSRYGLEMTGRPGLKLTGLASGHRQEAWGLFLADGVTRPAPEQMPLYRACQLGEEIRNMEMVMERADGQRLAIIVSAVPVRDDQGRVIAAVNAWRDISELKRTEEELRKARDELEQRVTERTEQLRQRAQQLSVLASELTLAEQRERRRLAQVLHDHLQQLLVGAKFGLEILARRVCPELVSDVGQIRGLMDESIQASRSLTVELSPPILHEAGLGAAMDWLARWMRDKYALHVLMEVDPQVTDVRDDLKVLLFQSVRELLFNVVKHAHVMKASVKILQPTDRQLHVIVSDEGVGFDPQAVWLRGANTAAGFGLFSIQERLTLLGGRLEIQSGPQQGSTFTLIMPLQAPSAAGVQKALKAAAMVSKATGAPIADIGAGTGIRVLLVDDHVVMRQGLSRLLQEEEDLEVVGEASNGVEAIEKARQLLPDVILMDFSMPVMDGIDATRIIHEEQPDACIIGLSMYEEQDRSADMLRAGAMAYLTKSGRPETLMSTIRRYRDRKEPEAV